MVQPLHAFTNLCSPCLQVLDGGETLTLRSVTRHHAGKYRCHASNGVGQDAAEEIHLQVLCKKSIIKLIRDGASCYACSILPKNW